jgi:Ras-related protein Rab-2A
LDAGLYEVVTTTTSRSNVPSASFPSTASSSTSSSTVPQRGASYNGTNNFSSSNNNKNKNGQPSFSRNQYGLTKSFNKNSNSDATNDWDRRHNQVQREDIAQRSRAGSSRAASEVAFDGLEYEYLFKFIIVGNMSVGKSCLLMRFADNQFKEHHQSTIGVDFGSQVIQVGDTCIKIQIWDTAGQEDFRAITRAYYREACAALLVYDATNRQSFTEIRTWLQAVRNNSTNDHIVMTLVGNKSDLCGRHTGSRRVKTAEGEKFADNHGMLHIETSAKSGANVNEAFSRTALAVYQKLQSGLINIQDATSGVRGGTESINSSRRGARRNSRETGRSSLSTKNKEKSGGCC